MSDELDMGAAQDPRVETLLRVNKELAAEIRGLQEGRISKARSAAAPSARRLGRLLADHDDLIVERDRLLEELEQLRGELGEREGSLRAEADRVARLGGERAQLVEKIDEYGRLAEALKLEVERLRWGVGGLLRRGVARAKSIRRR